MRGTPIYHSTSFQVRWLGLWNMLVNVCRLCILRQGCPELALPCRHMMDAREFMRPDALHPRYLRDNMEGPANDVEIICVTTETGLTNK